MQLHMMQHCKSAYVKVLNQNLIFNKKIHLFQLSLFFLLTNSETMDQNRFKTQNKDFEYSKKKKKIVTDRYL